MRFNKENMKAHIVKELIYLEKKWGFDPRNGYDQVKDSDLYRVMAYGEYKALKNLWDAIEYNNIGEE